MGRHASWAPGEPPASLPVILPAEILSKGRVRLPAELFAKVLWLEPDDSPCKVALEVIAEGHVRIVPKTAVDQLMASEADMVPRIIRRVFASQVGMDRRLVLPTIFSGRVFPDWTQSNEQKAILECHADHVDLLSTESWMNIISKDRGLLVMLKIL